MVPRRHGGGEDLKQSLSKQKAAIPMVSHIENGGGNRWYQKSIGKIIGRAFVRRQQRAYESNGESYAFF